MPTLSCRVAVPRMMVTKRALRNGPNWSSPRSRCVHDGSADAREGQKEAPGDFRQELLPELMLDFLQRRISGSIPVRGSGLSVLVESTTSPDSPADETPVAPAASRIFLARSIHSLLSQ